ncbi:MAG: ROK family protein [Elusimicrobia bacterium]|nr:ROK family protein [Elusimicrobiota bacterium]
MKRLAVGMDIGGTFTKLVAVSAAGRLLAQAQVPTEPASGVNAFISRVSDAVRSLERPLGRKADAVGIGVAGDVDADGGRLRFAPNLKEFEGFPLRDAFSRGLKRPACMHNDANTAAWGGYVVEFKRGVENMAAITMGTGIGGGLVLGRRLFLGSTGSAGEIGHMRIIPGGARCGCGGRGCLEAYAGRHAIVRAVKRLLAQEPRRRSVLRSCSGRIEPCDAAEAAAAGDPLARDVWAMVGRAMGLGISNLVMLLNLDAVILVGGVSRAGPLFIGEIQKSLRRNPFRTPCRHVRVRLGRTSHLGALGAGLLSLEG